MRSDFWQGKKVLVGGGCGFLGSYLVPQLVEEGACVSVVDTLENGSVDALEPVRGRVKFAQADLRDYAVCARATRGQDVVLNLAARAYGMDYSRAHHGEMLVYNLMCTLNVLEAARANGVGRFLIVSSSCVYPDDAPLPTPELDVFTGLPETVNEGYGWAKRIQELAGRYYARDYAMKVSIVRPFNLYGANYRWGSEEKAHVLPALVKRVMDGEDPLVVWGSGQQRRNFLHGSDAARLIMKVVEKDVGPVAVNVGYEEETSMAELAELICEVAGVSPRIEFDTSKPEGQLRKSGHSALLREITDNYRPQVSLREGIQEMIGWYRKSFGRADNDDAHGGPASLTLR